MCLLLTLNTILLARMMELTKESFMKTTLGSETVLFHVNPLSTNPTKWSNTLKQFVGSLQLFLAANPDLLYFHVDVF